MLNETWKEQYERMQRSLALLQQIGEQNADPQDVIPDERFARLETELCSMADHIRELDATLRTEIDNAIAVERKHSRVVQLRDISWTLGGIAVSIIGYICQLI